MAAQTRVEIFIPRGGDREDPNLFVGINGTNYLLPRGKKSMVPKAVAEEIKRSNKAVEVFYDSVEKHKEQGKKDE